MTPVLCPHCGQALPEQTGYLTDRELDVLTFWWMSGTLREAAELAHVGEQRAKNMMSTARIRNKVDSNESLLAMHFDAVRRRATKAMQHNLRGKEAA